MSGPSFLGLGDERSRDLDYLLEDEPPRGHGRLYLALLLLVVSAGLLAWHWQRDGYPWSGLILKPTVSVSAPVDPALRLRLRILPLLPLRLYRLSRLRIQRRRRRSRRRDSEVQPPAAEPSGSGTYPRIHPRRRSQPIRPSPSDGADSGETRANRRVPALLKQTEICRPRNRRRRRHGLHPRRRCPSRLAVPRPTTSKPSPALASPTDTFEDRLVADGEKYLYGRGVPEDCARAQRNLQIGARQSNPKAQTLLGAMYATGHCVGRDLPTAYRWFAKALHGDPGNSRVQRDLEVLWKQMTPEERQLAMKSQ